MCKQLSPNLFLGSLWKPGNFGQCALESLHHICVSMGITRPLQRICYISISRLR